MNFIEAFILSVIEGITEFLPISSTGHMIIASHLMGIAENQFVKNFEVMIQLGAIFSVLFIYKNKFMQSSRFYLKLFIAFLPTGILGFLLKDFVNMWLESIVIVGVSLILGGFVLIWSDRHFQHLQTQGKSDEDLNWMQLMSLGLWQSLALIPGVSRSGATIIGGLFSGLHRQSATEFSFFLAVPTMAAATLYKFAKGYSTMTSDQFVILAFGFVISFIVAILAIRFFVKMVSQQGFKYFGYYRILIGLLILLMEWRS